METNSAYAKKLSSSTDMYLREVINSLQVNAQEVLPLLDQPSSQSKMNAMTERLRTQTSTFNTVTIVSEEGTVLGVSSPSIEWLGEKLTSIGARQAIKEKQPLISKPYIGIEGELIIFITVPLIKDDEYKGFLGGAIYHFNEDGSYVYVVDFEGQLIYHQKENRLKDDVTGNPVVKKVITGESGKEQVVNTKGITMLAGYSFVPIAKWGIVSQKPLDISVAPAKGMVWEMMWRSLPLLILAFFLVRYISRKIALPLENLAYYTEHSTESDQKEKMEQISDWYYEARQLKGAMLHSLNYFKNEMNYFIHQSTTDPLTKLTNRRTMDSVMKQWVEDKTPFAMIILDIDKFKRVNDRYGHSVGDEVLIYLTDLMHRIVREQDICCRYGGEEFVILLPKSDKVTAYLTAERIREKLEDMISPCGEVVTISSGVAAYPLHADHPARLIELADQSLYEAKRTGRNKTIVVSDEPRHE